MVYNNILCTHTSHYILIFLIRLEQKTVVNNYIIVHFIYIFWEIHVNFIFFVIFEGWKMKTQMMAAAAKRPNVIGGQGMTMINFIKHIFTKVGFIFFVFLSLFLRL
jgi:hypothetical protein